MPPLQVTVPAPFASQTVPAGPTKEQRTQELLELLDTAASDEEADMIFNALTPEEQADLEYAAGVGGNQAPIYNSPVQTQMPPGSPFEDLEGLSEEELLAELQKAEDAEELAKRESGGLLNNSAGVGVRNAITGLAALPGFAADTLIGGPVNAIAGEELFQPTNEVVQALLDKAGLPRPASRQERMIGSMGEFAAGVPAGFGVGKALQFAGKGGNSLAQILMETSGKGLQTGPKMQTASAIGGGYGAGLAKEEGYGPVGEVAGALAGSMAPGAAGVVAGAGVRGLARGGKEGQEAVVQAIEDYAKAGDAPTVGQASPKEWVGGLEAQLSRFLPSSRVIRSRIENQGDNISNRVRQGADYQTAKGEPVRPAEAGEAVTKNFEEVFQPKAKEEISRSYEVYDKLVPPDTITPPSNFLSFLKGKTTPVQGAEKSSVNPAVRRGVKDWGSLLADARADIKKNGGFSVSGLKSIREGIGAQLSDGILKETDLPQKDLRAAYAALSKDMEAAAAAADQRALAAGKPANALAQFKRANAKAEQYFDHLEEIKPVLDKKGGGEQIFRTAIAGTKDGATRLQAVYHTLSPEGKKVLSAAIIRRTLAESANEAGGLKYLPFKDWSPEMEDVVIGAMGKQYKEDFSVIKRVINDFQKNVEDVGYARRASEGRGGFQAMLYPFLIAGGGAGYAGGEWAGAAAGLMASTAALGFGSHALARVMVNPDAVHFLAKSTTLSPSAFAAALNAYVQEAKDSGDYQLAEDLETLQAGAQ